MIYREDMTFNDCSNYHASYNDHPQAFAALSLETVHAQSVDIQPETLVAIATAFVQRLRNSQFAMGATTTHPGTLLH